MEGRRGWERGKDIEGGTMRVKMSDGEEEVREKKLAAKTILYVSYCSNTNVTQFTFLLSTDGHELDQLVCRCITGT